MMCSLNNCEYDCNNDEISKNAKDLQIITTLCRKCKCDNVDVLLIGQSGYCRTCFLTVINHKFRAALGKSKIIRHGDSILVEHTGKLNSTVLLHLIKTGMSESTHKKLIFKTIVLYVDDCTVIGKTNEERKILQYKIAEETKDFGFNGYIVSLSQILNEEDNLDIKPIDHYEINKENDNQLNTILANLPDDTSRTDLLNQLRQRLLILAARKLNCNKIFIADSAMDIATKVFGDICLGRGAHLSTVANFCDARCDIKILKPMRDFTQQELIYYSECHKINLEKLKEFDTITPVTSIQALTRNFIAELESQFTGTVSTVFRTAEKVSPKGNMEQNAKSCCALCDAKLVSVSPDDGVSAMRAIEVSRLVSSKCIDTRIPTNNKENGESNCMIPRSDNEVCCNDNAEYNCEDNKKRQVIVKDLWKCLCYSCRQIFRNSKVLRTLPLSLLFTIQKRLSLNNMREEIDDFIL